MANQVDLITVGLSPSAEWPLGKVIPASIDVKNFSQIVNEHLQTSEAEAFLFWDSENGAPDSDQIETALHSRGDLWHAGLQLGMSGLPRMIDHISPTWMLNHDVKANRESTSWRLSFRAMLVKTEIIRKLGFIHPGFRTFEGAALELGHRYITRGAIPRNLPALISTSTYHVKVSLPLEEEVLFCRLRYGSFWTNWALFRSLLTGQITLSKFLTARKYATQISTPQQRPSLARRHHDTRVSDARVSVLIPTLERYPYLRNLLDQLRKQTLKPLEIIVVDQTPKEHRDLSLEKDFADLPLKAIYLDAAGQCSSRNCGLQQVCGDYILLLDDDVEVDPNLIEAHVQSVLNFSADSCSGVIRELGAGDLPEDFKIFRVSDVFPAGNTLIPASVLVASGLFDLAYERGPRADGDLGMRIYQTGALMILNPNISVLHHRAPRGGLREHKARVVTYASSRQKLTHRQLPSNTEIYLARRHFSPKQVREMLWIRTLGTFTIQGSRSRKLLKFVVSLIFLPHTLYRLSKTYKESSKMLQQFPQIPAFTHSIPVRGML